MRWQPFVVAAGLLAPPIVLAAAVWPEGGLGGDGGDGIEAELRAGDTERSSTNGFTSTDFLVLGPGQLRISVEGPGFDPTLTLIDPDSGDQLAYNDDFDDLNPSLVVELDEGASVRAQVRSLGGPPGGAFEISVQETADLPDAGADGAAGAGDVGRDPAVGAGEVVVEGDIAAGDVVEGTTGDGTIAAYLLAGPGDFVVRVDGPTFDPTLRVLDDGDGTEIIFNDDAGGSLNPSVTFSLAPGQTARLEVGVFGVGGGDFTIEVSSQDGAAPTTVVVPPPTAPPPIVP